MNSVWPYPSLSRFEPRTYGWAMDQLAAGNDVRRWHWPIEVRGSWETGRNAVYIWHVYPLNDSGGMCKGFCSGVVGADNDFYDGLGIDSMGYKPTAEDLDARDWQRVSDVTQEQIRMLDARRWPHYPAPPEYDALRDEQRGGLLTVALIVAMFVMLFAVTLFLRR